GRGKVIYLGSLRGRILNFRDICQKRREVEPLEGCSSQQPVKEIVSINEKSGAHVCFPSDTKKPARWPVSSPQLPVNLIAAFGVEL
ncbi:hypothetical protein, partial [Klebsiella sp. 28]